MTYRMSFRAVLLVSIIGFGGASPSFPDSHSSSPSIVRDLLAPYNQLKSIRVVAEYSYLSRGGETGNSTLTYWGSALGYRSDSDVSSNLVKAGFMGGQIRTFDGSESRLLWKPIRTLLLKRGELPDTTLAPNPLFLPLSFLDLENASCEGCRPSFLDVQGVSIGEESLRNLRTEVGTPSARDAVVTVPPTEGHGARVVTLRGDQVGWWVKEVSLYELDGELSVRYQFFDPAPVRGASPSLVMGRRIVLEAWGENEPDYSLPPAMTVNIEVSEMTANVRIPEEMFTIPENTPLADTVIDEDAQQQLRAPSCTTRTAD